jgi:hypothetical protein
MKLYTATATSDWGFIYQDEQIKATSFHTAFGRAAYRAEHKVRRRPKEMSIKLRLVGTIKKDNTDYLGLPADESTPEEPC